MMTMIMIWLSITLLSIFMYEYRKSRALDRLRRVYQPSAIIDHALAAAAAAAAAGFAIVA